MVSRRKSRSKSSSTIESSSKVSDPPKRTKSPWSGVMSDIRKAADNSKMELVAPDMFADIYGVKHFIDTGLPSLNIYLGQDGENVETGDPVYGVPTGRIMELVGSEQSFKTFFAHKLGAEVVSKGGIFFYISSELDFDLSFFKHFYDKRGLDWDTVQEHVVIGSCQTPIELQTLFKTIFPRIEKFRETKEGKEAGPILMVVDSLGGMMGGKNRERMLSEKDEGDQVGSHAKEIHDALKYSLRPLAKNDVALIVINHYRDNLGFGFKKYKPAHDSTMKYYCTTRVDVNSGQTLKVTSRQNLKYIEMTELKVEIRKVRGHLVGDGKFNLIVYQNTDFDYWTSLMEALLVCDIVRKKGKSIDLNIDPESEDLLEMECAQRFDETSWVDLLTAAQYFKKDPEGAKLLEKLAYKRGPILLNVEKGNG